MNSNSKTASFFFLIGALFILSGIIVNEWIVSLFFSYSGSLKFFDRFIIWALDFLFIALGVFLIKLRHTIRLEKKNVLAFFLSLIFIFLLTEVGARIFDRLHGQDFLDNKVRASRTIIPFRMFGPDFYAEKDGIKYISSRHQELYPLKKSENTFRIVAFGGSTTQNFIDGVHYPLVLERLLNARYPQRTIEVINVGNSAYATPHSLILLELDVLSWDPDLVILSHNFNDLLVSYFPDFAYDYSNKYKTPTFLPEKGNISALVEWSRLYWILKSRLEALSYKIADFNEDVYLRRSYGKDPPEKGQLVFRRNLKTFFAIALSRRIPVIFGTQPLEPSEEYWSRHMRYKKYNDIVVYPLHEEFILHHRTFNKIIKEVARETGSLVVDNDAIFAGERAFFTDLIHYTKEGVEKLAENYYDIIVSRGFIK